VAHGKIVAGGPSDTTCGFRSEVWIARQAESVTSAANATPEQRSGGVTIRRRSMTVPLLTSVYAVRYSGSKPGANSRMADRPGTSCSKQYARPGRSASAEAIGYLFRVREEARDGGGGTIFASAGKAVIERYRAVPSNTAVAARQHLPGLNRVRAARRAGTAVAACHETSRPRPDPRGTIKAVQPGALWTGFRFVPVLCSNEQLTNMAQKAWVATLARTQGAVLLRNRI